MTVSNEDITSVLQGAYDLHVHPAPDVMDRSGDDIEFANMAKEAGMKGFAIKSHYVPTADRAYYVNKLVPGMNVIGTLTLNNAIGGMNPQAVDIAGRAGARLVWLPTVDSLNEFNNKGKQDESKLPYWALMQRQLEKDKILRPPIRLFDDKGNLLKETKEIISLFIKYKLIMATGHLSPVEGLKLVKEAVDMGLERIIITHPDFPTTFYTIEQQKEMARLGAFLERCYTTPATNKVSWEHVLKGVMETGPEHNLIATDLGQKTAIFPVEGFKKFAGFFLEHSLTVEEVRQMTVENAHHLLR